jgi:hypothetical protein
MHNWFDRWSLSGIFCRVAFCRTFFAGSREPFTNDLAARSFRHRRRCIGVRRPRDDCTGGRAAVSGHWWRRGAFCHSAALYVRGYNGQKSTWYQAAVQKKAGRIVAAGMTKEVTFEPVAGPINDSIDDAYCAKYGGSPYVSPLMSAGARAAGCF